jgi:Fe-S-cluster containining protein
MMCGKHTTECKCDTCIDNCRCKPGQLFVKDLALMIPQGADPRAWARTHLRASEGPLVIRIHADGRQEQLRVPTLVPANVEGRLACRWLKNDRCVIYSYRPSGCAFFDCKTSTEDGDILLKQGCDEIMADRSANGLYSQLWDMLDELGLRAPALATRNEAVQLQYAQRQALQLLHSQQRRWEQQKRPRMPGMPRRK